MNALPDTNVWISWLGRLQAGQPRDEAGRYRVFLTTLALQELWAGARSARESRDLNALLDVALRRRRLVNPPPAAWVIAGRALRRLAHSRRIGGSRLRNLRNDVLLAATAVVHGAAVLTYNRADFALLRSVMPVSYVVPDESPPAS